MEIVDNEDDEARSPSSFSSWVVHEMKAGGGSAVAYAWFVWEKGFQGNPEIEWI